MPSTTVVINEVCTRGPNSALDEFVELRNISLVVQQIGGWQLVACNADGTEVVLTTIQPGTQMQPRGEAGDCFLVANAGGYSDPTPADRTYGAPGLEIEDLGGVKLVNPDLPAALRKVDAVGFADGLDCTEGCPAEPLTQVEGDQGLCHSRDALGTDTDLNCVDFRKQPRSPCR